MHVYLYQLIVHSNNQYAYISILCNSLGGAPKFVCIIIIIMWIIGWVPDFYNDYTTFSQKRKVNSLLLLGFQTLAVT